MTTTFKRMVLASRPQAEVTPDNFRLETVEAPALQDGQVLVRNHFLSLDPYMRGRMSDAKSYAAPQPLDETMIGGTVGQVVESKHPKYAAGDFVVGMAGWTELAVSDGSDMRKIDTTHIPLSAYLGPDGMPGMTACMASRRSCRPRKAKPSACRPPAAPSAASWASWPN